VGALPRKKITKAKRARRLVAYRLRSPALSLCPQCHTPKRPHRVCPSCGFYKGREVMAVKAPTVGEGG
jgi:large subunit ribosomal protein L32